jgi:uncharacterized protein YdiU (UPF0061 family)
MELCPVSQGKKIGWNLDNSYSDLPGSLYSRISPEPVKSPKLVVINPLLATMLGLSTDYLRSEEGVSVLAGNLIPINSIPIAQAYAGHQFGHFTMLGDGRAVLLGEQISPSGKRYDIQLKGSGRTPYSRGGDGRAALGPMLREYIISEAMHALGIPTTRSLAVVTTGETVYRDTALPGAILTRVAASHIRVGTFEYVAKRRDIETLRKLTEYTIKRHYPYLEDGIDRNILFLKEVIKNQALLIAKWQLVGFIHGVMNTDNMTISGESIDYGPCAFMNEYDPETVFSSIDWQGRYAYGNQPTIAEWNLARLAEALLPLLSDDQKKAIHVAEDALLEFYRMFHEYYLCGMRLKLGLFNAEPGDAELIDHLLDTMHKHKADFTNTFLALTFSTKNNSALFASKEFHQWHELWQQRLNRQNQTKTDCQTVMQQNNPALIPRNHRVEEALEAAVNNGDYSYMDRLMSALAAPFAHLPEQAEFSSLPEPTACAYKTFCGT